MSTPDEKSATFFEKKPKFSLNSTRFFGSKVALFSRKNPLKILDNKKKEFARGLSSFSSKEINLIMGCHSNEIQKILGYVSKSEVVHKDDMVEI